MKTYGKYSILIQGLLTLSFNLLFFFASPENYTPLSPISIVLVLLMVVFGKMVSITNTEIKCYALLWFMCKRRSIKFSEFNKVNIHMHGFTTYTFWNNDEKIATWYSNIYKFEARKIEKVLEAHGIETSRSGADAWSYFD